MGISGRHAGDCRAWLDSGYVCGLPRGHEQGSARADDLHSDADTGDVWHDDDRGAHPAPPAGPVPSGHPNFGKDELS